MTEASKLNHDTYKHMTTLSSGSLLLIATLVSKVLPNPSVPLFAWLAVISFFLSILMSVVAMFSISYSVGIQELPIEEREKLPQFMTKTLRFDNIITFFSCGSFIVGMLSVAIFGVANIH